MPFALTISFRFVGSKARCIKARAPFSLPLEEPEKMTATSGPMAPVSAIRRSRLSGGLSPSVASERLV